MERLDLNVMPSKYILVPAYVFNLRVLCNLEITFVILSLCLGAKICWLNILCKQCSRQLKLDFKDCCDLQAN